MLLYGTTTVVLFCLDKPDAGFTSDFRGDWFIDRRDKDEEIRRDADQRIRTKRPVWQLDRDFFLAACTLLGNAFRLRLDCVLKAGQRLDMGRCLSRRDVCVGNLLPNIPRASKEKEDERTGQEICEAKEETSKSLRIVSKKANTM